MEPRRKPRPNARGARRSSISPRLPFASLEANLRIGFQEYRNLPAEQRSEFGALLFTDSGQPAEGRLGRWISTSHFPQCGVGENNVGRDIAFIGQLAAERAQAIEENLITGNLAL